MSTYKGIMLKAAVVLVVVAVVAVGWSFYSKETADNRTTFKTATVKRGDITSTISATGTVEPEEVVDVGAQVAGQITSIGKDKKGNIVDYGSEVEEGTVLVLIDDSTYAADVQSAIAGVDTAKASVVRANADLKQLKARLFQADRDWQRARKLGISEAMAESTYDSYQSAYETAVANVAIGEAAIEQATSSVEQANATLTKAKRNLGYCVIKNPVSGVVIDRRVNIGQTVVSSMSVSSLFLIAKDLGRMRLWVPVNEADIGHIRPGQVVTFTVDAFPQETFKGEVLKVRLNASMTQNVVTYVVEVVTDNSSGRLLPYLTANAQFQVDHRENVLTVSNSALRWSPKASQIQPVPQQAGMTQESSESPKTEKETPQKAQATSTGGWLWVVDGDYVRSVRVTTGLTDGTVTEIAGDGLQDGMAVVVGEQQLASGESVQTRSPFTPQFRRSNGTTNTGSSGTGTTRSSSSGGPPPPM